MAKCRSTQYFSFNLYDYQRQRKARDMIKKAHRADMDIILTANILMHEVHQLQIQSIEELYIASEEARIPQIINFGKHRGTAIADLPADLCAMVIKTRRFRSLLTQGARKYQYFDFINVSSESYCIYLS